VFAHYPFADHNRILEVVTLPWHECHFQILSECEFAILSCITFSEEVALLHLLSFLHGRLQVDAGLLVCLDEFCKPVDPEIVFEAHEFFLSIAIVAYVDFIRINEFNHTVAFGVNLNPCITSSLSFETCTNNWHIRTNEWHSLALHVRSHERTVGVIMLEERNE